MDNLPCALPRDASDTFAAKLLPHLMALVTALRDQIPPPPEAAAGAPLATTGEARAAARAALTPAVLAQVLPPELHVAVIAAGGQLMPDFAYITRIRAHRAQAVLHRRILVLGAGLVSAPCVAVLLTAAASPSDLNLSPRQRKLMDLPSQLRPMHVTVTVCDTHLEAAQQACAGQPPDRVRALQLDVTKDPDGLAREVARADLVISLLPAAMHHRVVSVCLAAGRPLVTASYIHPKVAAYRDAVTAAGIPMLFECGLDPGLDHMSLVRLLATRIRPRGGTVTHFESWCGGLPSPEAADNPLGYKFSWSPYGALQALHAPAVYRRDGARIACPDGLAVLADARPVASAGPRLALEGYPNRDSLVYAQRYGLGEPRTLLRGTLRFPGYADSMRVFLALGWLSPDPSDEPAQAHSWPARLATALGMPFDPSARTAAGPGLPPSKVASHLRAWLQARWPGASAGDRDRLARQALATFRWLGILDLGTPYEPAASPLRTLLPLLQRRLAFARASATWWSCSMISASPGPTDPAPASRRGSWPPAALHAAREPSRPPSATRLPTLP